MSKKLTVALCLCLLLLPHLISVRALPPGILDDTSLWLVNYNHSVDPSYVPPEMTELYPSVNTSSAYMTLRSDAAEALISMFSDMCAQNISNYIVVSGYRSYDLQDYLHTNKAYYYINQGYSEEDSYIHAAKVVAPPGKSEHQLGLAVDLSNYTLGGSLSSTFLDTDAGLWLSENARHYGFIHRYPADKTEITAIIYEPWHYRFVGLPHAQIIEDNGLCFEEYIETLENGEVFFRGSPEGRIYEVYFTAEPPADLKNVVSYSSSNTGGYIVTLLYDITEQRNGSAHSSVKCLFNITKHCIA